MGSARPWERKLFHTFDGHRFDWRWGLLESLLRQLDEMWPTLVKYFDTEAMSKNGELGGFALNTLDACLKNVPGGGFESVHLMIMAVSCISAAVGTLSRWFRGCDCCEPVLRMDITSAKRRRLMQANWLQDGHCPLMGRRICHVVHIGLPKQSNLCI